MIRWNGMDIFETVEEVVNPKHTVLLMWDWAQNIVGNTFYAEQMTENAARLLEAARANGVLTAYSHQNNMHLVGDTGAPTIRMRQHRARKPVAEIAKVPPPVGPLPKPKLVEKVKPRDGDIIFEKFTPNAFLGTCFEWWLKKYGIKSIVLTGINVATGISGTAREAVNLGYYAVVAKDCVGTSSKEDYDIAIASLTQIFDVLDADEIIKLWNKSK